MKEPEPQTKSISKSRRYRWDRAGKRIVAAHIEAEAYKAFKTLGAELTMSTDILVHHALALLFAMHHRPVPPSIARKLRKRGISVNDIQPPR
jgi:hypothetical protein